MGMDKTTSPVNVTSFRGLNTKLSDVSISDREATALLNVNITKEKLEGRRGCQLWTTTQFIEGGVAKPVVGIYQGAMGGVVYRIAVAGTKIYSITEGGVVTDITGTATVTDDPDAIYQFVTFIDNGAVDVIIGSNGIDPPFKWDGSGTAEDLAGVPGNFKYMLVRKNRLWGTIDDFLYVSAQLDGETYDLVTGIARFKSQGVTTDALTGLSEYGDSLVVCKEDGVWLMSGESFDDGYIQRVVTGDGNISGYAIKEIKSTRYGNILVLKDRRGHLKGFNGSQNLIHLTDFIDDEIASYNTDREPLTTAVNFQALDQYITNTTYSSGTEHDILVAHDYYLDGIDGASQPESTILIHSGIRANYLATLDINNAESLMIGTYGGWILQYNSGSSDVESACQIDADPTGAVRSSNVVTITTLAPHGFSLNDVVTISGVDDDSFDGEFVVTSVGSTTEFTYAQTGSDDTSGGGVSIKYADIDSYWQSKKYAAGNAAIQKQINDFDVVFTNNGIGEVRTTVVTDRGKGESLDTTPVMGAIYGQAIYGQAIYGGTRTKYYRINFEDMAGTAALVGRYFTVKFRNVDSFRFGIEEFIIGITPHGFQAEYTE